MSAKSLVDQISMFVRKMAFLFCLLPKSLLFFAHIDEIISGVKTQNAENK